MHSQPCQTPLVDIDALELIVPMNGVLIFGRLSPNFVVGFSNGSAQCASCTINLPVLFYLL